MYTTKRHGQQVVEMDWDLMRIIISNPNGTDRFEGNFVPISETEACSYKLELDKNLVFKLDTQWWHLKMPHWLKCHCKQKTNVSRLEIDKATQIINGSAFNEISFFFTSATQPGVSSPVVKHFYEKQISSNMSYVTSTEIADYRKNHVQFSVLRIDGESYLVPDCFDFEHSTANDKDIVHLCANCTNCAAKPKSEGGCLKVLHYSKTIEDYPFILEGRASCSPLGDGILVTKCADYVLDSRKPLPVEPYFFSKNA